LGALDARRRRELDAAVELTHFGFRAMTARPDALLASRGLSRVHHRILYFVGRQPGLSVKDLLTVLAISKQALHAPLRQLVEMGLVLSGADDADGRVRRLRLSGEGVRLEAKLAATQTALLVDAFARAGAAGTAGWFAVMGALGGEMPPLSAATR